MVMAAPNARPQVGNEWVVRICTHQFLGRRLTPTAKEGARKFKLLADSLEEVTAKGLVYSSVPVSHSMECGNVTQKWVSPRYGNSSFQYKPFPSVSYSMHKRERGNIYHGHRQFVTYKPWPLDDENATLTICRCASAQPDLAEAAGWAEVAIAFSDKYRERSEIDIFSPSLPSDDRTGI
ncbi:hypothetical protein BDD12DRAFT_275518 [Trichophaea hybrida]|nr:hypothetical protein BDD12DRAFT_275518 [Trichophaea hybrida]